MHLVVEDCGLVYWATRLVADFQDQVPTSVATLAKQTQVDLGEQGVQPSGIWNLPDVMRVRLCIFLTLRSGQDHHSLGHH